MLKERRWWSLFLWDFQDKRYWARSRITSIWFSLSTWKLRNWAQFINARDAFRTPP
jgi:hypothetical protein